MHITPSIGIVEFVPLRGVNDGGTDALQEERLSQFRELLEVNTNDSALVLHNLLGPVKLKAKYPDIGKPYYLAYTSINALATTELSPTAKVRTMVRLQSNGGLGRNQFEPWQTCGSKLNFNQHCLGCDSIFENRQHWD